MLVQKFRITIMFYSMHCILLDKTINVMRSKTVIISLSSYTIKIRGNCVKESESTVLQNKDNRYSRWAHIVHIHLQSHKSLIPYATYKTNFQFFFLSSFLSVVWFSILGKRTRAYSFEYYPELVKGTRGRRREGGGSWDECEEMVFGVV